MTFFYNGGPGSSTIWLHMGSFGPRIVETANAQATGPAPYHVVNNGDSLLDRSDLVFIDAVSTGFSRIVGKGEGTNFWGVDGDVEAFGKFITRYVTLNHRWNSPKFLFGESYGTTRSAALVYYLQGQGMFFNGVVLLSSILNYAEIRRGWMTLLKTTCRRLRQSRGFMTSCRTNRRTWARFFSRRVISPPAITRSRWPKGNHFRRSRKTLWRAGCTSLRAECSIPKGSRTSD